MPPTWLTVIAWLCLALAFLTAGAIVYDIYARGYRQKMAVMEAVWPVTALYFGPLAWWGYRRWGRLNSSRFQRETRAEPGYGEQVSVAIGVSHCGAGCTLGDIIGAWVVFAIGWELAGLALPAEYIADFALAFALGIAFQYFSIAPMRGLGLRAGIAAALKADTLSLDRLRGRAVRLDGGLDQSAGGPIQLAGYRYVSYTPQSASVVLALKASKGLLGVALMSKWIGKDWRVQYPPGGCASATQLSDLSGYVQWSAF